MTRLLIHVSASSVAHNLDDLRLNAAKCRELAARVDPETAAALNMLAQEYEDLAGAIESGLPSPPLVPPAC